MNSEDAFEGELDQEDDTFEENPYLLADEPYQRKRKPEPHSEPEPEQKPKRKPPDISHHTSCVFEPKPHPILNRKEFDEYSRFILMNEKDLTQKEKDDFASIKAKLNSAKKEDIAPLTEQQLADAEHSQRCLRYVRVFSQIRGKEKYPFYDTDTCGICLDNFNETNKLKYNKYQHVIKCGHIFHYSCILEHSTNSPRPHPDYLSCPMCRAIVKFSL
jgi:hypothetical protein